MQKKKDYNKDIEKRDQRWALQAMGLTTAIGTELAVTVVSGYYCGLYLDRHFGTGPWLMLAGVIAGIAIGITGIYKTLQRFFAERK
ncbi:AtpZ/AtpI family protein [Pelotomaculum isophthalicicum JI]|uniref:AtpZ/AtpI family protein n=1 Tax=Pelotomaculum isophthalicicum JI TaxID=947010 RepID=A0A9X4GYC3_9FIRM|nr:AtpZ/AtpI family protein [Pelotomaculum isophthalicicum]MDF9407627.1 AtpZ/AtpI family protein [Pelotomaculum isophthalicicum JI]